VREKTLFVNGSWRGAESGQLRAIIDPFDQSLIARVAEGDRVDSQAAIAAAREAFDHGDWPRLSGAERGAVVARLGELIATHAEELARLETKDTGKTLEESRWDLADVAGVFAYYAQLAGEDQTESVPAPDPEQRSRLVREPAGVCSLICPWNYPLLQASWKVAPALAAGCTMVLKPSEITPLTTIRLVELAVEAGIDRGVLNLVLGPGPTVGAELAENRDVDLVSFTGGLATGRRILQAAATDIKRVALELGGKNPHIIFADADEEAALDAVLNGVFFHAGQICSAGARVMIQEPLHARFVERLRERMAKIKLGSGLVAETRMGPLISAEHRSKVESWVATGIEEGARLVLGGFRPREPELAQGFFYLPTLFLDCRPDMQIVREEVFGPVITVERFATEAEAVTLANDTVYGLSAGFWTRDEERIERVSSALRFGTVWVNSYNVYFASAPWGGYKQSGIGRELGRHGLDEYTEVKHLCRSLSPKPLGWF
jgi:betaine-aldehyde dehydrogenase